MGRIDPIPHLERWLSRARVIHIHGVGRRDHQRLSLMTGVDLDPVVQLLDQRFGGVLTFEVFSEESFLDSLETFRQALGRTKSRGVQ
jgi:sugar phosphate isomerase/epimerase